MSRMRAYIIGTLLLAVILQCPVHGQVTDKAEQNQITACSTLDGPACLVVKSCAYCRSRWGESKCISANQRSAMPADAYPCRNITPQPAASQCDNLEKLQCTESTSCSWCESAAVGNACYTKEDAKKLPGAIFSCTNTAALNVTSAASPEAGIEGLGIQPKA